MVNKQIVNEIVLGTMLGDGGLEYPSPTSRCKNPLLGVTHCLYKEKEQTKLLRQLISTYYTVGKLTEDVKKNTIRFRISSKEVDLIKLVESTTRLDRKRFVDVNSITLIVLLFWYLDDGSLTLGKQKRPKGYTLYRRLKITAKSYSEENLIEVCDLINSKFKLNFKIDYEKGKAVGLVISNNKKNICDFLSLLEPYMYLVHSEMNYKFCLGFDEELEGSKLREDDKLLYRKHTKCKIKCECRNKILKDFLKFND